MNRQYTEVIHNDLATGNDSPAVRELVEAARAELVNGAEQKAVITMLQNRGLAYPTALEVNNRAYREHWRDILGQAAKDLPSHPDSKSVLAAKRFAIAQTGRNSFDLRKTLVDYGCSPELLEHLLSDPAFRKESRTLALILIAFGILCFVAAVAFGPIARPVGMIGLFAIFMGVVGFFRRGS